MSIIGNAVKVPNKTEKTGLFRHNDRKLQKAEKCVKLLTFFHGF